MFSFRKPLTLPTAEKALPGAPSRSEPPKPISSRA